MAQEEHTQRYSNSSGGDGCGSSSSRSSKRLKEKKVPQRGLGVAQLEKIRLEEQQKKDVPSSSPISFLSPSNCSPNFRHNPSPSLVPLPPPPLPTDLSSPVFRQDSSIPSIDFLHPNAFALSKPSDGDGGDIGWPLVPGLGQGYLPKFWNGDYNILEGENQGLAFRSNVKLPFESKPVWAPQIVTQRANQIQQQLPSTSLSMVNVSSGTSSSSQINYAQMEPPSNQSFHGKNNTPIWSEEEKMVGRKRSYPFSLDNVPGLSFPCKVPTNRSNEPSSGNGSGGAVNVELNNPIFSNLFREGSSSSSALPELNPKKDTKGNEDLNGDFLTLAPPTMVVPRPGSNSKHPSMILNPHSQELPDFESLPFQGSVAGPIHQPGPSVSTQHQAFYTFYPSAKARIGPVTTGASGSSSSVGENLDLNLKL
ncbi:hypothetical protein RHMOL_Rhmol06G0270400 [Rhododendron molle]|uniref:Uncharacterized protein n=1 Tax=Rhododendron molle TaxID=49168 RepID=A0ACC0NGL6_RHOML|nr:hypothetical protein RHMOL_Rhmol06G0270400 [Rhododendron molle]